MGVEFNGAGELRDIAKQLQNLEIAMRREVEQAMADEMKALQPKIRRSAITTLPTRGGLDRKVAMSQMTVAKQRGGVRLRALSKSNIRNMNRGFLFHPVYARADRPRTQWKWVRQQVRKGWFDQPTLQSESRLRRAIDKAQQRAINRMR